MPGFADSSTGASCWPVVLGLRPSGRRQFRVRSGRRRSRRSAAASVKIPDLEGAEKIANFAERRSAHAARVTQLRGLRIRIDIEEFGAAVVAADDEHRMAATMKDI